MVIISIPEIKKIPKNSTNFKKNLLKNSKPNYCRRMMLMMTLLPSVQGRGRSRWGAWCRIYRGAGYWGRRVQFTDSVQCAVCSVHCAVFNVQCTVCSACA